MCGATAVLPHLFSRQAQRQPYLEHYTKELVQNLNFNQYKPLYMAYVSGVNIFQ